MSTPKSTKTVFRGKDLTGKRFGLWLVLKLNGPGRHGKPTWWLCRCDCRVERLVQGRHLNNGASRSCGCVKVIHSGTGTAEYAIYHNIIQRCENPTNKDYPRYGAKGVKMCQRWRGSYPAFLEDISPRPSGKHTLDRYPDPNGDYCPENVRWATPKEQANNRRNNHYLEHEGQRLTMAQWAELRGMSWEALYNRLSLGWSVADALDRPLRSKGQSGVKPLTRKTERPTQPERLLRDELYSPSLHPVWLTRLDTARQRVRAADLLEAAKGLELVGQRSPSGVLREVLVAVAQAVIYKHWSDVAEAAVLIQELERRLRAEGK